MRAASDLAKLYDAAQYRLVRIRRLYSSLTNRPLADRGMVISTSVMELDNLIISTLREFTISSLVRTRTVLGHRVATNRPFRCEAEISAHIISIVNSIAFQRLKQPSRIARKDEPTVRDPKTTEKILVGCAASNLPSLQNALALNLSVFRDIPTLRNFYAHRNEDTWKKVKDKARIMGIIAARHTDDLVQAVVIGRPSSIFEDWLGDLETFFEELMK
jgi:hypothetical protein